MKRILLFGGFGFIGTNILKYIDDFLSDKYSVIVFDRFNKSLSGEQYKCIENVFIGDFLDNEYIIKIFSMYSFDYIFHLVSSTVPSTSDNAVFDIESNLIPTIKLLQIMKEYNVSNIIYLSSGGAVYGNCKNKKAHQEDDFLYPVSSYGIVKSTIERYLCLYHELYDVNSLILRLSNPYGPYHYSLKQGIINVALRKAINKDILTVWGNGEAKKDYIYIDDFCLILFKLLENNISNDIFNIASGEILSINQILIKIKEYYPNFKYENKAANKSDVSHIELNTKKLIDIIGNISITPFYKGLLKTITWLENSKHEQY